MGWLRSQHIVSVSITLAASIVPFVTRSLFERPNAQRVVPVLLARLMLFPPLTPEIKNIARRNNNGFS